MLCWIAFTNWNLFVAIVYEKTSYQDWWIHSKKAGNQKLTAASMIRTKYIRCITKVSFLVNAIVSCDSAREQNFEAISTKKMFDKIKVIQQDLRNHCDSMIYADAKRMADSMIIKK